MTIGPNLKSSENEFINNLAKSPLLVNTIKNLEEANRLIKEIGEHAGIDENYTVTKTLGGIKQAVTKPKYEWIMTHTGRRSFCTNAYLGGLDSLSIMAVSGHTTENNFLKYIKVTPMQQAERIAQHPYFQTLAATPS